MTWYYQTTHPLEVGKPMAEVKKNFVEDLPIVIGISDQVQSVINIVENLLQFCQKKFDVKQAFIKYIKSVFEPKSITEKLEDFDKNSFKDFCAELKKQKVKLSSSEQMDLLPLFEDKIKEVATISSQIKQAQLQLDTAVFEIYGIEPNIAEQIKREMIIE